MEQISNKQRGGRDSVSCESERVNETVKSAGRKRKGSVGSGFELFMESMDKVTAKYGGQPNYDITMKKKGE